MAAISTASPLYRKAFLHYLRTGTPIALMLKAASEHPTQYYIWHTQGDDKVRPEHAANEGQIFAWDDPPATGHPGEAINCRCWAEDYYDNDAIDSVHPEIAIILARFRSLAFGIRILALIYKRFHKPDKTTTHGAVRLEERNISITDVHKAIESAKSTGNVVKKIGKYGTEQIQYNGSNGVTVIVESEGRNAGKIITAWRQ